MVDIALRFAVVSYATPFIVSFGHERQNEESCKDRTHLGVVVRICA